MSEDRQEYDEEELELAQRLGAEPGTSSQVLTLYIPNKDRQGNELGTQRKWVLEAAHLLAHIGGGVTIMPPTEGGWLDEENDIIVWEQPVVVYTYIKPDRFIASVDQLREFVHRMGRETNQGEIAVEFDHQFYRIIHYDPAEAGES